MKKALTKFFALTLLLMLALTISACGPAKLLIGSWTDESGNLEYEFHKDGTVEATMYGFPLEVTYTFEGDTLTIVYTDELTDSGTVTFYGDDEFIWDKLDEDGEAYQEYYTRGTSD